MKKQLATVKELVIRNGFEFENFLGGGRHMKVLFSKDGQMYKRAFPGTPGDHRAMKNWEHQQLRRIITAN